MPYHFQNYSQNEFGAIAYEVVGQAMQVQQEICRLGDEKAYANALKWCLGKRAETEVPIRVSFEGFSKKYFLDLVVDRGAIFELKKVTLLTNKHRSQLLVYLMLTNTSHGKLMNFGLSPLDQEFVNCGRSHIDRTTFQINDKAWCGDDNFRATLIRLLQDWGTGLDIGLYEQALSHSLARHENKPHEISIAFRNQPIGTVKFPF